MEQQPEEQQPPREGHFGALAPTPPSESAGEVSGDWVDAQFSRLALLLCSSAEPAVLGRLLLHELAPLVRAAQGAAYVLAPPEAQLSLAAGYAAGDGLPARIAVGEGLLGQCAVERRKLVVRGVSGDHFRVHSALGSSAPAALAFVPVALGGGALVVLELAFVGAQQRAFDMLLDRLAERRPSSELALRERPTLEPGHVGAPASAAPEGPSAPPAVRHGFWSTLSHELRSPLNSVIVLSQVLSENTEHNLSEKQVNLARVIHGSGKDLLALVDDISLLAKIEARRLVLAPGELGLGALRRQLLRAFRPLAAARGLRFFVELGPEVPAAIVTDPARLRQVLECLLAVVIERAEGPAVHVRVSGPSSGWSSDNERLNAAREVLAFTVDGASSAGRAPAVAAEARSDEGPETPRSNGGSDEPAPNPGGLPRGGLLGLAISRELAPLLGGELQHDGVSAVFTLYLPAPPCELRAEPSVAAGDDASHGTRRSRSDASEPPPAASEPERQRPTTAAPPAVGELEGLELLLVDHDVRQAFTLTGQLERQGAAVAHADDLGEALERLRARRPPSAVLIDARVLGESPESSVQRLLRLAEHTPCVVLQGAADGVASLPHVHRMARSADAGEVVALLRRVAVAARVLQTRAH